MAFLHQKILKSDTEKLNEMQITIARKLELLIRNSEVIVGMGMVSNVNAKYNSDIAELTILEAKLKKKQKAIGTTVKTLRYGVQISITFISAILIIKGKMSSGGMIAVSTLSGKVLAPFDASASVFAALVSLKKSYERLKNAFKNIQNDEPIELPEPKGNMEFSGVIYAVNQTNTPIIKGISFKVEAGQVIGVIGKSGSGKTTLARLLTGIFEPNRGKVLLDSSPLNLWKEEQIGKYIGYLPQDVELFQASIKENISRFAPSPTDESIVKPAQIAGVHELIMSFPNGYATQIGQMNISAISMLTLRTATVIISAPEATRASRFCSNDSYFPVPIKRREENSLIPDLHLRISLSFIF
jgi:ABC-type protease/lipase transport system fused ATPase/permease subunit